MTVASPRPGVAEESRPRYTLQLRCAAKQRQTCATRSHSTASGPKSDTQNEAAAVSQARRSTAGTVDPLPAGSADRRQAQADRGALLLLRGLRVHRSGNSCGYRTGGSLAGESVQERKHQEQPVPHSRYACLVFIRSSPAYIYARTRMVEPGRAVGFR